MNETIGLMRAHRSVRKYTDEAVASADVEAAVRAGQAAATSSAVQAYCVIRVTDPDRRAAIAELAGPQEKVRVAPEFFVVCADSRRHRLLCEREGKRYEQELEAFLVGVIDATLFAQNMVLAFESMGYGTCYIGGIRNDLPALDRVLGLPEGVYPVFGVCVGRAAESPAERPRLGAEGVVFDDAYPSDGAMLAAIDAYDARYRAYLRERGASERQVDWAWGRAMAEKFATPSREALGAYYRSKGACLD